MSTEINVTAAGLLSGLGNSATKDVGTTSGTVAAGDDSRFTDAADHIADTSNPHSVTAAQAGAVATSGDETIAGVKTFSSSPIVPTPTTDYQAATKKYVDDTTTNNIGTNLLINGDFKINQRSYVSGTATTSANQFTFDRWFIPTSGENLTFASNKNGYLVTAPSSGISQVVEGVNIEGGTYSLSWTGTASATVDGASVSNGGTVTLTAGTNCVVNFSSGTVYGAKLELGSTSTSFISDLYDSELKKCQRYYQKLGFVNASIAYYGYQLSGNGAYITLTFPSMRAAMTGSISGTWVYGNCCAPMIQSVSVSTITVHATASTSSTVFFQCTASSGIILSAELTA